jgi:hypothetical protein
MMEKTGRSRRKRLERRKREKRRRRRKGMEKVRVVPMGTLVVEVGHQEV